MSESARGSAARAGRRQRSGRTELAATRVRILLKKLDDHRVELHQASVLAQVVLGLAEERVESAVVASHGDLARLLQ